MAKGVFFFNWLEIQSEKHFRLTGKPKQFTLKFNTKGINFKKHRAKRNVAIFRILGYRGSILSSKIAEKVAIGFKN